MKIAILSDRFPYPPTDGVKIKLYNLIRSLSQSHEIYLISFYENKDEANSKNLDHLLEFVKTINLFQKHKLKSIFLQLLINIFQKYPFSLKRYDSKGLKAFLKKFLREKKIDVVYFDMINMAKFWEIALRYPKIISPNDCVSERYKQEYNEKLRKPNTFLRGLYLYSQFKKIRRLESDIYPKFQKCHVVTENDKNSLQNVNPNLDIEVIPIGVDFRYFEPNFKHKNKVNISLILTGDMNSMNNIDGVLFFANKIYPLIKERANSLKVYVVGKDPHKQLLKLSKINKNFIVTGFVKDLKWYLENATIYISPLIYGTGIKTRILEAMAMEKAIVATTISCQGIEVINKEHLVIADTPEDFAAWTLKLIYNQKLRRKLGKNARELIIKNHDWQKLSIKYEKLYYDTVKKFKAIQ